MTATSLEDKLGWVDSDMCWWCSKGKQTREHFFKEYLTRKKDCRRRSETLQATESTGGKAPWKSRRGFGYRVPQARARPNNTTVRGILSDSRHVGAVLKFRRVRGLATSRRALLREEANCFCTWRGRLGAPWNLRIGVGISFSFSWVLS